MTDLSSIINAIINDYLFFVHHRAQLARIIQGGWTGINNFFSMGVDDDWTVIVLTNIDILSMTAGQDIESIIRQVLNRITE